MVKNCGVWKNLKEQTNIMRMCGEIEINENYIILR